MHVDQGAELVCRCLAGDEAAFAELFEQYKKLVYSTAYLMTGSVADAEDVLQEVFLQVYRKLGGYNPARGSLSTWLHRLTVNRCLGLRRRRWRTVLVEGLNLVTWEPSSGRGENLAERDFAERDCVRQALFSLKPKLRAAVVLRYYWGLSYAEIADVLDVPLGTVKSRLSLAMRQMKEELELALQVPASTNSEVER